MGEVARQKQQYAIQSLSNGLRVMEIIAGEPHIPLKRIAQLSEMTLSQAFRIVATLELAGYVIVDDHKRYSLGYKCLRLGNAAGTATPLVHLAREEMDRLAAETRESISLVVRDGLSRTTIDLRESPHQIRISAPIGERLPLHYGGTGPCLLAFSPEEVIREALAPPLERATAFTETDPEVIRRRLEVIRAQRCHVALQDYADGAFSVAAPILNEKGMAAGALSVSGPLMRFDSGREQQYVALVKSAASRIEAALAGEVS